MKYRKKPVVIEAVVVPDKDALELWGAFAVWMQANCKTHWEVAESGHGCHVETLEGNHYAREGDYMIIGVKGEMYPCKPDIFAATYEAVT